MRPDFAQACKTAKSKIVVPRLPLETIRLAAARRHQARPRRPLVVAGSAIAATMALGFGVAFGARILSGIRIWLAPSGKVTIAANRISGDFRPSAQSLRATIADAPFRVFLPIGLPHGARLRSIFTLYGGTRALVLTYAYPIPSQARRGFATFMLSKPSLALTRSAASFRKIMGLKPYVVLSGVRSSMHLSAHWVIGNEEVTVLGSSLKSSQIAHIKASMGTTTPETSLDATILMTGQIIAVGAPETRALAEQHRQPGSNGYLVGGELVPALVQLVQEKAVLPIARGSIVEVIDRGPRRAYTLKYYAPGTPVKPSRRASPAPGISLTGVSTEAIAAEYVRSIASVFQTLAVDSSLAGANGRGSRYDFLVNHHSADCDWVWTLPRAPGTLPVHRYQVNRQTFKVIYEGATNGC